MISFKAYQYLPIPIFVLDKEYKVAFWNKRIEILTQISAKDIVGKVVFEFYPHLKNARYYERIKNVVEGGLTDTFSVQFHRCIIPILLEKDVYMAQQTIVSPIAYPDSNRYYAVFSIQDYTDNVKQLKSFKELKDLAMIEISERKLLEKKNKSNLIKLQRSNDELTDFAHAVSHDLKAPIQAIINLTKCIKEDNLDDLDEDSRDNFELIDQRLHSMRGLVNDLLSFALLTANLNENEDLKLNDILKATLNLLPDKSNCTIDIAENLPVILGSRVKIQQVFQNLLSNSIKYSGRDYTKISVGYDDLGDCYQFFVQDNGVGIKPEIQDRVFKLFQTGTNPDWQGDEGSGMGLAIVKKIITHMEGEIWIESDGESGTKMLFKLPKEYLS